MNKQLDNVYCAYCRQPDAVLSADFNMYGIYFHISCTCNAASNGPKMNDIDWNQMSVLKVRDFVYASFKEKEYFFAPKNSRL